MPSFHHQPTVFALNQWSYPRTRRVFGELAALDGEPRSADAIAQEASELLQLQSEDFLALINQRPGVAIALLRVLSRRLRHTSQTVEDAAFLDVPARLSIVILRLLEEQGQPDQAAVVLNARLRQSDLAGMVGTRRETLNRWLRFYEDWGLIRLEQGAITVLQPERLRKRVY